MQFGEIADICLIRMKFEIYQGLCFCQKTKYQPITDLLRLYAKSQKYRYRNLISQVFEGSKLLVLDIFIFESAYFLQINSGYHNICHPLPSIRYHNFLDLLFFPDLHNITIRIGNWLWRYSSI